MFSQRFSS